jgi:hypothetical protein
MRDANPVTADMPRYLFMRNGGVAREAGTTKYSILIIDRDRSEVE